MWRKIEISLTSKTACEIFLIRNLKVMMICIYYNTVNVFFGHYSSPCFKKYTIFVEWILPPSSGKSNLSGQSMEPVLVVFSLRTETKSDSETMF
jgi:hypothetical protein